ncbi:uncharacterized protein LOC112570193 [Pomacea canaliculata]|uniref:uncharacterized protein LOC112570193 n=1 Tax=Pomacea canaliculata TaxID=400727 RepID=UPI000D726264|nr:uncharacterized protein LOC112570193 [Pomacea canaliculata]
MIAAGGQPMKYPYTISAKLAQFPYRWHWKHGRFIRFLAFTLVGVSPLIITIHKAVHSPENERHWEEIRRKREHSHFDPVH